MLIYRIINKIKYIFYIKQLQLKTKSAKKIICQGYKNIFVEENCSIGRNSWLAAVPLTGAKQCNLIIKQDSYIGNFAHIYATKSIIIEKKVIIADRVYISDNMHGYEDINVPIIDQPIIQKKCVVIGEGSWIGENVCIIGSSIGKHCIVGANSVVTHDIPDYCVVAGSPAKIIKQYDFLQKKWIKKEC